VKLKLDENIPGDALLALRSLRVDADTVVEERLAGGTDPVVLNAARADRRMLITLDRGFGDVRSYPPGTHPGIVVLRPIDQRPATIIATLERLVIHHDLEALAGCVVVVHHDVLRVRRPADGSDLR
jgi:predicted nuclease of predicted toxin-antitoxin system